MVLSKSCYFGFSSSLRNFQSPLPLQIFLLVWDEFLLVTAVAGVEKEKEFNIPSQFLKYSDPLVKVPTILQSVSVFLLSEHLEVDPTRIIFLLSLWAYGDCSREIRVGISLRKIVFICIFNIVLVALVGVPVLLLVFVIARTLPDGRL